jgi:hypothetical protein
MDLSSVEPDEIALVMREFNDQNIDPESLAKVHRLQDTLYENERVYNMWKRVFAGLKPVQEDKPPFAVFQVAFTFGMAVGVLYAQRKSGERELEELVK